MTQLRNELINDKGVCRTAPATPGLLKEVWGNEHINFDNDLGIRHFFYAIRYIGSLVVM